jgi:1-acyl-sn-glycerol-3-phosphate acyltransferase
MLNRWLGNLARFIVRTFVRGYYSQLEVAHPERIPNDKGPILFIANHPNSLIDPVVIGLSVRKPIHFFAKAPLFDVPIFGAILKAVGMIPAFRASDDKALIKNNLASLSAGAEMLARGEHVGIFPEGKSHDAIRLEAIKTGAARLAMQAVEMGAINLRIVPLGINYQNKEQFRSSILVQVGDPIDVSKWLKKTGVKPAHGHRELTPLLDKELKKLVIHVDMKEDERHLESVEKLLISMRNANPSPIELLHLRKQIADAMNQLGREYPEKTRELAGQIDAFRSAAGHHGLDLDSPVLHKQGWPFFTWFLCRWLHSIATLPFALAGAVFHMIPFLLVRFLAPKMQQPGRTTVALTRLYAGLPGYAVWYAFMFLLLSNYFLPWVAWTLLITMPFLGVVALGFLPVFLNLLVLTAAQIRLKRQPRKLEEILSARTSLAANLDAVLKEHQGASKRLQNGPDQPSSHANNLTALMSGPVRVAGYASLAVLIAGSSWFLRQPSSALIQEVAHGRNLARMDLSQLEPEIAADEIALREILKGVDDLEAQASKLRQEFIEGKRDYYRQADNDLIRQNLLAYLNYRTALLRLIWKYQKYEEIEKRFLHNRAMLLALTSATTLYGLSESFVNEYGQSPEAIRKLNEAEPLWGVPAGLYNEVRDNLSNQEHRKLLEHHLKNYDQILAAGRLTNLLGAPSHVEFHAAIQKRRAALAKPPIRPSPLAKASSFLSLGKLGWYQTSSVVSTWIGDTKIREPRDGKSLIDGESLKQLGTLLKPGDIILERRNWYLSNAFLPGYWPHFALYVGKAEDIKAMGIVNHPLIVDKWGRYVQKDKAGHEHVIVEAVSEGVVFSTLEHSIGAADSVAILRPKVSETVRQQAILRAFGHVGKPYDFDFDFFSTDKLVCTEVVFRSYDGAIDFPLVEILGRKTMPAIEFVKKFGRDRISQSNQVEFIAFLEGNERTGKASFQTEAEFIATSNRPALTWLQN